MKRFLSLLAVSLLAACATPQPAPSAAEPAAAPVPVAALPAVTPPPAEPSVPGGKPAPQAPPAPAAPALAASLVSSERAGRQLLQQLLPAGIADRSGWASDIFNAFRGLHIPFSADYFCATLAVIEQESSWQADPVVPGLNRMVWHEIESRAGQYHVPLFAVKAALLKPSSDGRSYVARIDALRTEKQMNTLFEDMMADASRLGLPVKMSNPIRTGGPMQVSVDFAQGHASVWPYPYPVAGSLRHEVFTRRGGVYFGAANLLHYRAPYAEMRYRFADYNAGRYSSRNAAFQAALARLSRQKLALDGDLLRYRQGRATTEKSSSEAALQALAGRLRLRRDEIRRDLLREKSEDFAQTLLYQRVFALAEQGAGQRLPRAVLPSIQLHSPKISRKLSTAWFAERVNGRYQQCLARQLAGEAK